MVDSNSSREGRVRELQSHEHTAGCPEQQVFEALIGVADADSVAVASDASPAEQVTLQWVSSNFLQGLGALPVIGRPFREDEDRVGQEPVVIVSHRFWTSRFGTGSLADPKVRINKYPLALSGGSAVLWPPPAEWNDVYAPLA
jgi:hypothetical protein